jgi:protein-S-isoprenylcysteine O-methyltransferase Ste14
MQSESGIMENQLALGMGNQWEISLDSYRRTMKNSVYRGNVKGLPIRTAVVAVGILILLAGTVFALQGANVIGGSSMMNWSSTWIYVGGLLAVIGVLVTIMGFASKPAKRMASPAGSGAGSQ